MLFFGHKFIQNHSFYHVLDIESIMNTPSSSTLYIEFEESNLDIIKHAQLNEIKMAIKVASITEILFASSLEASYIVVDNSLAKDAQKIATEYLFDAKILVLINDDKEIENLALLGVDGVVYSDAIVKINS